MDDVGATVAQLLNECQLSTAVHKRAAKTLTGFRKEHPSVFAATLTKCLHRVMLTPKVCFLVDGFSAPLLHKFASLQIHWTKYIWYSWMVFGFVKAPEMMLLIRISWYEYIDQDRQVHVM